MARGRGRLAWALAIALTVAACTGDGDDSDEGEPPTTSDPQGAATDDESAVAGGSSEPEFEPEPPFVVGSRTLTFTDPSRSTAADAERDLPARDDRTIEVLLLYPGRLQNVDFHRAAEGGFFPSANPRPRADPSRGRFPLVVFSHGLGASGPAYTARVQNWVQQGYVVALPTYPLTTEGAGFADVNHVAEQPADVSFVIDSLAELDADADDPLAGRIDTETVAAAGHSLGAITTFGAVYAECCIDDRIDAAIPFAGMHLDVFEGEGNFDDPPDTPQLLVHGAQDGTVPIDGGSDSVFEQAESNSYYLRFPDGDHIDVVLGEVDELVDQAVLAFLEATLKDEPEALDSFDETVEQAGSATFRSRRSR